MLKPDDVGEPEPKRVKLRRHPDDVHVRDDPFEPRPVPEGHLARLVQRPLAPSLARRGIGVVNRSAQRGDAPVAESLAKLQVRDDARPLRERVTPRARALVRPSRLLLLLPDVILVEAAVLLRRVAEEHGRGDLASEVRVRGAELAKVSHHDVLERSRGAPLVSDLHDDSRALARLDPRRIHGGVLEPLHHLSPVLLPEPVVAHREKLKVPHGHLLVEDEADGGTRRLAHVSKHVQRASGKLPGA